MQASSAGAGTKKEVDPKEVAVTSWGVVFLSPTLWEICMEFLLRFGSYGHVVGKAVHESSSSLLLLLKRICKSQRKCHQRQVAGMVSGSAMAFSACFIRSHCH